MYRIARRLEVPSQVELSKLLEVDHGFGSLVLS